MKSDYSPGQIRRWRPEAEDAVWQVTGVWSSWIDEKQNRITFAVYTSYTAEKAREALAETSVPTDAVAFEVDPKKQFDYPPVQIDSPMGISISLEFQRNVLVGQPITIEVLLTNNSDLPAEVEHSDPFEDDVTVFASGGDQVWTKLRGVFSGVGKSTRLEPGEHIRLPTLWEQRDLDGFASPPGCYLVRGRVRFSDGLGIFPGAVVLATEPYELIIHP